MWSDFLTAHPAGLRLRRNARERRPKAERGADVDGLYIMRSPTPRALRRNNYYSCAALTMKGFFFARALAAGLGLAVEGGVAHPWVAPIAADLRRAASRRS